MKKNTHVATYQNTKSKISKPKANIETESEIHINRIIRTKRMEYSRPEIPNNTSFYAVQTDTCGYPQTSCPAVIA